MRSATLHITCATAIALMLASFGLSAKRTSPCDTDPHGQYTNMLCPGDHLVASSFLTNSGDHHRFYFDANGSTYILDVSTTPWTTFREIYMSGTVGTPGYLMYDPGGQPVWSFGSALAYNSQQQVEYGIYNSQQISGGHFMRLDNDGCLRFYDQDGARVYLEFCSL